MEGRKARISAVIEQAIHEGEDTCGHLNTPTLQNRMKNKLSSQE
jgi:hypothetical protein